jgi:hypothetical protein
MGLWRRIKRKYRKIKKIMAEKSNAKKEQPKE